MSVGLMTKVGKKEDSGQAYDRLNDVKCQSESEKEQQNC